MPTQIPVARCLQSQRMHAAMWPLVACQAPALPRYALVASTVALAHEHHSSIIKLVEAGNFGSAAALIRPLIETAITGAWALYCAPAEVIEGLFWNKQKMPKPNSMLTAIERRPELKEKLGLKKLMEGKGTLFHRFTHGDMDQLRRRFNAHGYTFSEQENLGTLYISDLMLLLSATIFSVTTRERSLELFLEHHANSIVFELRDGGAELPEWEGWQPLPDPLIPLGMIPKM